MQCANISVMQLISSTFTVHESQVKVFLPNHSRFMNTISTPRDPLEYFVIHVAFQNFIMDLRSIQIYFTASFDK